MKSSPSPEQFDDLYKIRHSLAHVMAQAVLQIRPNSRLAFGPPIDTGFYYDFELSAPLTPEDFPDIEKRMRRIINEKQEFSEFSRTAAEAVEHLKSIGEQYKAEYCAELAAGGETSIGFYKNGPFEDMCRGPHVANTSAIPGDCFSIDSIAGAYWRGDSNRPQLTRLYALCFRSKKELTEYKERRKLAEDRDHRKLGAELEIFRIVDDVGPGLPFWMPNGTVIREEIEKYAKETEFLAGYQRVATPHITKENIFFTSGHLPLYKDSMFPPMKLEDEESYYLKPMNCPFHHQIYNARPRSYRELPLRYTEYGHCYRYEDSGALTGLLRVRMLTMNDAHIYCTQDQMRSEFKAVLELNDRYFAKFRIENYTLRLSTHDPENRTKFVDNPEAWKFSEKELREILDEIGVPYVVGPGEAAFYGPKVDVQVKNILGREESTSTVQLDFAQPASFGLRYVGADGKEHMPYIIHRAPLSTHERFISYLLEFYGGAFPTWMSPVQVAIIPISEKFLEYAESLRTRLFGEFVRVEVDSSSESFNKKIRSNVTRKIPNILVIGGKEAETESVTWRRYAVQEQRTLKFDEFAAILRKNIAERVMDNFADVPLG
ncbi:MAG: threonine--tRNA ligase [Deltaproteobacteria bacterium]|nr:threonine--tRNA ligase [Deltaproteobacteria bacterium]